ncbi:MAG: hypothetical protein K2K65_01845 [Duncaniella sp.]|nr:hypothetical protein [Duncaniella sp.]
MDKNTISVRVHAAVINGEVHRNCIVNYSPTDPKVCPKIIPFSTELHSTTSYNGIVIFAPEGFSLPSELDMPHAIAAPGGFTDLLRRLAAAVPNFGQSPHSIILLPL